MYFRKGSGIVAEFIENENRIDYYIEFCQNVNTDNGNNQIVNKSGREYAKEDALAVMLVNLKEFGFPCLPLFVLYSEANILTNEAPTLILKSLKYKFYYDGFNVMGWGDCPVSEKFYIEYAGPNKIIVIDPVEREFFEYENCDFQSAALSFIRNDYKELI